MDHKQKQPESVIRARLDSARLAKAGIPVPLEKPANDESLKEAFDLLKSTLTRSS